MFKSASTNGHYYSLAVFWLSQKLVKPAEIYCSGGLMVSYSVDLFSGITCFTYVNKYADIYGKNGSYCQQTFCNYIA